MVQLLDMCMTDESTAHAIFSKIDATLKQNNVPWNNCVSIGMDNTSVNVGRRNSIMTKVQVVSPSVFVNGCACHIIHNTAIKAASAFETVTRFNVEDICIDIYYWFDKSTKRKQALKEFCEFCDLTYVEMVKHVSTRWLSLEKAVSRILQKYEDLKSYFLSNEERHARFIRLAH